MTIDSFLNAKFWDIVPTVLWSGVFLIVLLIFRKEFKGLFQNMVWRIRTGSSVKFAAFEIGQSNYISRNDLNKSSGGIQIHPDKKDVRFKHREQYYKPNRNIQLVHKIAPSIHPDQLYDILVYVVPHFDGTLISVQRVEYYFGRSWDSSIFTSIDRARNFAVATSAYGPFICTAEIYFTDGEVATIGRFIDFEMGAIGTQN
jgi:hypothetical protein